VNGIGANADRHQTARHTVRVGATNRTNFHLETPLKWIFVTWHKLYPVDYVIRQRPRRIKCTGPNTFEYDPPILNIFRIM
jgi:endonuclease I